LAATDPFAGLKGAAPGTGSGRLVRGRGDRGRKEKGRGEVRKMGEAEKGG